MVAYSFQRRFVDPIRMGRKTQTVRGRRKRHARPGEALQLYTGMRTKCCELIGRATCDKVVPIDLHFTEGESNDFIELDGVRLTGARLFDFARADGFEAWPELREFWRVQHGPVILFEGVMIEWKDLEVRP